MTCILAVMCLTASIANAQVFTDGDIVHLRDNFGTLTDVNLVPIPNMVNSLTLSGDMPFELFFRVTIKDGVKSDTVIDVTRFEPDSADAYTLSFAYQNGANWSDLQTTTTERFERILYNTLKDIATAQSASTVEIRVRFSIVPGSRFQLQIGRGTAASPGLNQLYFDCHPGYYQPSVFDVTDDDLINSDDISAVSQARTNNSLTGDVSEDGNINYVDFDLVSFAVAQGMIATNRAPIVVSSLSDASLKIPNLLGINVAGNFYDPDGDSMTFTATSSDTTQATVDVAGGTLNFTSKWVGTTEITVTASDGSLSVSQSFTLTILPRENNQVPTVSSTTPVLNVEPSNSVDVDLSTYFSDPDGDPMTYTATSDDTAKATVSTSGSTMTITGVALGSTTLTATATDNSNATGTHTFVILINNADPPSEADAIPGLSSEELLQLSTLLTYDTVIFNELHNGADDTNDWLELRNVSGTNLLLNDWELTIQTGSGMVVIPFPTGTVIPTGEVLLLTNTEIATGDASVLSVVSETFALPQTGFALILRSPTVFGDIAGNYLEGEAERPETVPALTVDTVWERIQPIGFGYRAEAWTESTHQNGLGTPGYMHPAPSMDLNGDGTVNILDLVIVAGQIGQPAIGNRADVNSDGVINTADLFLVAETF